MKKLIFIFILSAAVIFPQESRLLPFSGGRGFFLWNAVTGTNTVSDGMVQIFGSETRTKASKTDTAATKRSPQRWMVLTPQSKFPNAGGNGTTDWLDANGDSIPDLWAYEGEDYKGIEIRNSPERGNYVRMTQLSDFLFNEQLRPLNGTQLGRELNTDYILTYNYRGTVGKNFHISAFGSPTTDIEPTDTLWHSKTILFNSGADPNLYDIGLFLPTNELGWIEIDNLNLFRVADLDSSQGLSKIIYDLPEDSSFGYYHSIFIYAIDGDTDYVKGATATFTTPLFAPENLTANGQADKITLSWAGSPKSVNFYIQKASSYSGIYSTIDSATTNTYVDSGLGEATWYYRVFAKNFDKSNSSGYSNIEEGNSLAVVDSMQYSPTMFLLAAMDTAQIVVTTDSILTGIDTTMVIDTIAAGETASFLVADAETGDISQWTGIDNDGINIMMAIPDIVNNGNYSFLLQSAGSVDHRYYYTYSGGTDSVCTRFYFYMPTDYPFSDDATLRTYYLFRYRNNSTTIGGIQVRANTSTHQLYRYLYTNDSGVQTVTPTAQNITLDTWHYIEYRLKKGNGTGYIKVYYDGALWAETTGLTMTTASFNDFNYGISSAPIAPTSGQYLVLDDVLIDESPIGAYGGGEVVIDTTYSYDSTYTVTYDTLGTDSTVILTATNFGTSVASIDSVKGLANPFSTDFDNVSGVLVPPNQSQDINITIDRNYSLGLAEDTILVYDSFGMKSIRISVEFISPALTPPIDFTVTHNSDTTGFFMYWNDPLGTDSIEIYRSTDNSTYTKIATIAEDVENYIDSPFSQGTSRYYAAKTKRGTKLSEFSEVKYYTLPETYTPPTPSNQNEIEDGIKDWFLSASGTGSGTNSWSNAANYYTFNWAQVLSGDSVFIDGGTDSVVYTQKLDPAISGTSGNYITIGGGKSAGHNGNVVLRVSNDYTIGSLGGSQNYLIFRKMVLRPATTNTILSLGGGSNLIFEYLTLYQRTHGLQCQGGSDLTIRYCWFESPADYSTSQADLMAFYNGARRIKIHNNYLHQNNENSVDMGQHNDCIQANQIGSVSNTNENTLLIYNNILYQDNAKTKNSSAVMLSQIYGWTTFYNNLVLQPYSKDTGLGNQPIDYVGSKTRMWHNTIVCGDNDDVTRYIGVHTSDSLDFANNILYSNFNGRQLYVTVASGNSVTIKRSQGNAFYSTNSSWNSTTSDIANVGGTGYTLTEWKAAGRDLNGISTNPLMVNPSRTLGEIGDYSLQDGSPAKNIGINLQAEVEALGLSWTDINGNPRDATPNAGAYELSPDSIGVPPPTPTCTYTYSDWGACVDGLQTRTVISSSPQDCAGTPVLSRSCVAVDYPTTVTLTATGTIDQDDMCFWIHPTDASLSTVISSDKTANKLFVYDLDGSAVQTVNAGGICGNIDVIYGLTLGGTPTDLIAFNDRTNDVIKFYSIDPDTRQLTARGSFSDGGMTSGNYGLTTYKSPYTNKWYVFVSSQASQIKQWELTDNSGNVGGTLKRTFTNGSGLTEGMVCDNETGDLFAGNEDTGLYRIEAEPDSATTRYAVALAGSNGLVADLEGVTIYYDTLGTGYILLSSQGSDNVKVYERKSPYTYVGTFTISGASDMDGLDVNNHNFGVRFPKGVFAIHNGLQRVILTNWQTVVNANSFLRQPNTTYYDSRNP